MNILKRIWAGRPQDSAPGRPVEGPPAGALTQGALEGILRATDPAARLVASRVLRRVIRRSTGLPGFGLRVPHRKSFVVRRGPLLEIADRDELGFLPHEHLPRRVILLERLGAEDLAQTPADAVLLRYWRLLLHARVHLALEERIAAGELSPDDIRQRIQQLGSVEFDEIRSVLSQERFLLPPYDDATVYVEFAAVYMELRYFAPELLPVYFPALHAVVREESDSRVPLLVPSSAVRKGGPAENTACAKQWHAGSSLDEAGRVLAQDIDAEGLFLAARPAEAPRPQDLMPPAQQDLPPPDNEGPSAAAADRLYVPAGHRPSERKSGQWTKRAERAAAAGNLAGAAIRRARAAAWAPAAARPAVAAALREDIRRLVARLLAALDAPAEDPRPWREALLALAQQTPRGLWTVEARLLYDLQKVCADHERGVYAVDLVRWAWSLGRRSIKRPLPSQREVLMSKHLRSATRRLAAARIWEPRRRQLADLLRAAGQRVEEHLREQFRPRVTRTLEDVGLRPQNLPERVARKKLVEELLDQVVGRGFLRLGDLRDALSRNNLKLPDCAGPATFFRGDALLQADRRLSRVLDGVYERGEFYLRGMQRLSLLAFGTRLGRFLTRFLAVPFGGAFLLLAFVYYYADELWDLDLDLVTYPKILLLGSFLLGLIEVAWFRRGVWEAVKACGRAIRFLLIDCPRWLVHLPLVEQVLNSRLSLFLFRFVFKPLLPTILLWALLPAGTSGGRPWGLPAAFFVVLSLALNSRAGRNFEELAADAVVEGWHRIGLRILTGLFWLIIDLFRGLLQGIERLLYTVDEWLRFRTGQGRATLAAKAALGVAWFYVAYVVRFLVNVLVEPQLNPIKHFPVVTVSHKIMFPQLGLITHLLGLTMNHELAGFLAFLITISVPGICGFLVWELWQNWRLYAANRPKGLRPALLGPHGETMPRLLKPGLHSGTLPKRFAKLRRAARQRPRFAWYPAGDESRPTRKHREALRLVELGLRRYVQREFVEFFRESRRWQAPPPATGPIRLATNRVHIAILLPADCLSSRSTEMAPGASRLPSPAPRPLWITFELAEGAVLADAACGEIAASLAPDAHQVLQTALVGLWKTGGVDIEVAWDLWVAAWEEGPPEAPIAADCRSE